MFVILVVAAILGQVSSEELTIVTPENATPASSRIVGGSPTSIEQYPYTVQLIRHRTIFVCGGSLITRRHVLTAAHCFFINNGLQLLTPQDLQIYAGSSYLMGGSAHSATQFVLHERYNQPLNDNDIGVIVLSSRVTLSNFVYTAILSPQGYNVPDNAFVTHVGWGVTHENSTTPSSVLQEVTVLSVNRVVCAQRYAGHVIISNNMICAGLLDIGGRDACYGDSGGPLVLNNVVVGVTSFGLGCASPEFPGVNARVSSYTNWIQDVVRRTGGGATAISMSEKLLIISLLTGLLSRKLV